MISFRSPKRETVFIYGSHLANYFHISLSLCLLPVFKSFFIIHCHLERSQNKVQCIHPDEHLQLFTLDITDLFLWSANIINNSHLTSSGWFWLSLLFLSVWSIVLCYELSTFHTQRTISLNIPVLKPQWTVHTTTASRTKYLVQFKT